MKIKTNQLTDAALDWAVAISECVEIDEHHAGIFWNDRDERAPYRPSTDWAQGGPIIEQNEISLYHMTSDWVAANNPTGDGHSGPTSLIAAMRCYVAYKLGDEVEVPEELL